MLRATVLLFVLAAFSVAQTPDSATLRGQILDQSHAAIPAVEINVKSALTALERSTTSDSTGKFSLSGLPVGSYTLTAHKKGFADVSREITLVGGTAADVRLELNVSGEQTQVVVTGIVGEIRTDQPQLGDHLDATQVEETPLLNRRITFLPLLNAANRPALNQGDVFINQNLFTTNGSGRRQTTFVVDGSTGNDSWGRQTVFTNLPLSSVQEMTVLENAFSAEYGATTGGVVNIVTKSGSNALHGEILGAFRPSDTQG